MADQDFVTKLQTQQKRIDELTARRNKLAGEIEQLERQHEAALEKLKELGCETPEQAEAEVTRLGEEISSTTTRLDELLTQAEAVLNGAS